MNTQRAADRLAEEAVGLFEEQMGRSPRWVVAAPGRVNLIGEHTDYNDGFVLPMAIERRVVIAADRAAGSALDGRARLISSAEKAPATIAVDGEIRPGEVHWSSYVQGVVAGCREAGLKPAVRGRDPAMSARRRPVEQCRAEVAVATLVRHSPAGHSIRSPKRCSARKPNTVCPHALRNHGPVHLGARGQTARSAGLPCSRRRWSRATIRR